MKGLIKSALRGDDPVIFMMHKRLTGVRGEVGGPDDLVPIGAAASVRPGADVTLITYGHGVVLALEAAETLAAEDIDVRGHRPAHAVPARHARRSSSSVRKTGRVVVVDEAPRHGSLSAEIAASIQEEAFFYLDAPVRRVTAAHPRSRTARHCWKRCCPAKRTS